jgi:osmotically inducible protein OsmC
MALTLCLGERDVQPEKLTVSSTVTLDEVDGRPTIVSSALVIHGRVPGLDADGFQTAVDEAAALCPISRLFAGATVMVSSDLEPM